jgi:hypothetical protein
LKIALAREKLTFIKYRSISFLGKLLILNEFIVSKQRKMKERKRRIAAIWNGVFRRVIVRIENYFGLSDIFVCLAVTSS